MGRGFGARLQREDFIWERNAETFKTWWKTGTDINCTALPRLYHRPLLDHRLERYEGDS